MAKLKLGIQAVLGLIIGLLVTVLGWYIVPALSDILPITSLKTIFWIGVISYWITAVIISPLLMIMGGKVNFKGSVLGLIAFIAGYILSLIIYYTAGYILEALDAVFPNSTFLSIGWFGVYVIWILGLIIAPLYLTIKDSLSDDSEEDGL